jgi:hypothetical protein
VPLTPERWNICKNLFIDIDRVLKELYFEYTHLGTPNHFYPLWGPKNL